MHVVIIGGGVVGLCSAYYLSKSGCNVTIVDNQDSASGCSHGNAGMIVPSHFIPLAAPGMISKGIRWMFNSKSPFYVKPRIDLNLLRWGYQFYKHATEKHVEHSIPILKDMSLLSKSLYRQLSQDLPNSFQYKERGLLMLYKSKEIEREEIETARLANKIGIEADILTSEELQKIEPNTTIDALGGVYFRGDAHLSPNVFIQELKGQLISRGVSFVHAEVVDIKTDDRSVLKVGVRTTNNSHQEIIADNLVIAAGVWSGEIARKLSLNLPMQAGKGYSFTVNDAANRITVPSILLEARVAVTPLNGYIRFGGTMEITDNDPRINMSRVKGIVEAIPRYYPELSIPVPKVNDVWYGFRPCSPDGLPYIGRIPTVKNVVFATGHAMMGISLGPATGFLVSQLVSEIKTEIDLFPIRPNRFNSM